MDPARNDDDAAAAGGPLPPGLPSPPGLDGRAGPDAERSAGPPPASFSRSSSVGKSPADAGEDDVGGGAGPQEGASWRSGETAASSGVTAALRGAGGEGNGSPDPSFGTPPPPLLSDRQKRQRVRTPRARSSRSDPFAGAAAAAAQRGLPRAARAAAAAAEDRGREATRSAFERNARRYYYQLTVGCGNDECQNRICRFCARTAGVTPEAVTALSVQLASGTRQFFCDGCPSNPECLKSMPRLDPVESRLPGCWDAASRYQQPNAEDTKTQPLPKPFLHTLFSSPTFASVFCDTDARDREAGCPSHQLPKSNKESRARTHHLHSGGASSAGNSPIPPPRKVSPTTRPGVGLAMSSLFASLFGSDDCYREPFGADPGAENPPPQRAARRSKSLFDLPSLFSASSLAPPQTPVGLPPDSGGASDEVGDEPVEPSADVLSHRSGGEGSASGTVSRPVDAISCREIHEPSWLSSPNLSGCCDNIGHLSIPLLEAAVESYRDDSAAPRSAVTETSGRRRGEPGDPTSLLAMIRKVFSTGEALARSFLADNSADVSSVTSGLDLAAVRQAYGLIVNLAPAPLFLSTLTSAMEILLARIEMDDRPTSESRRALRPLLILLECPFLRDESCDNTILKRLVRVFGRLKRKPRSVLVRWFSAYPADYFGPVVQLLQGFLSEHYAANPRNDDSAAYAVNTLRLLYAANEADGRDPIVPISAFYNATVCRSLNFKEEHLEWQRFTGKDGERSQQFSYFDFPFLFDPATKSHILHLDAMVQMIQRYEDACVRQAVALQAQRALPGRQMRQLVGPKHPANPYLVFAVRRDRFLEDVMEQLETKKADLKKPMKVRFVGGGEEGLDQGGLQKELFQLLVAKVLDPSYGMFTYDAETRYCWINGNSLEPEKRFEQVGMLLGLALYNGIILGVNFPRLFYKKLLNESINLADVKDAFPALGRGLEQMLQWEDGDVYDVFMRSFVFAGDVHGQVKTVPLVDGGERIPVTNGNRGEFVRLYIKHLTHDAVGRQFRALKAGFLHVCGGMALQMCRPEELEVLLTGCRELDFRDLESGATYDGYHPEDALIRDFWSTVHDIPLEQKRKLLAFVTASDRVPIHGLSKMTFVIQKNGPDSDRLPTALTCFGRLLLPEYCSKEKLQDRLFTAIENAQGFGLI